MALITALIQSSSLDKVQEVIVMTNLDVGGRSFCEKG